MILRRLWLGFFAPNIFKAFHNVIDDITVTVKTFQRKDMSLLLRKVLQLRLDRLITVIENILQARHVCQALGI